MSWDHRESPIESPVIPRVPGIVDTAVERPMVEAILHTDDRWPMVHVSMVEPRRVKAPAADSRWCAPVCDLGQRHPLWSRTKVSLVQWNRPCKHGTSAHCWMTLGPRTLQKPQLSPLMRRPAPPCARDFWGGDLNRGSLVSPHFASGG